MKKLYNQNKYVEQLTKKFLSALVVAASVFLVACGNNSGSTTSGAANTAGTTNDETSSAADVDTGDKASATAKTDDIEEVSATADTEETRKITVFTGGAPAPYIWQNEDGSLDGYDIAVFNAIAEKLPQYEFEYQRTSDFFTSLDAGYGEVIVQHLGSNEERREKYLFSYPYYFALHGVLLKEDADWYTTFDDFAGHSTLTNTGSFNAILFEKYNEEHPDNPIIVNYTDDASNYAIQVANGSIDFYFFDYDSIKLYVEQNGVPGLKLLEIANDEIPQQGVGYTYFLTPQTEQQLHDDIDEALLQLIEEGVLEDIAIEYLGDAIYAPTVEQALNN